MNNRCATGAGSPAGVSAQPGSLAGTGVLASSPDAGAVPKQNIISALDRARAAVPGCQPRITPNGGLAARDEGTDNHPNGDAADIQLICGGNLIRPRDNPALYEDYIGALVGNASQSGIRPGIGVYGGFLHYDESPWRQGQGGIAGTWVGSDGNSSLLNAGVSKGAGYAANGTKIGDLPPTDGTGGSPADPAAFPVGYGEGEVDPGAAAAAEKARSAQANCSPPPANGSSGCNPISPSAVATTRSLTEDKGLAIPDGLSSVVADLGATDVFSKITNIEDVVGQVTQAAAGLSGASVLATISPAVAGIVQTGGLNTAFSALTGRLPAVAGQLLGNLPITSAISNVANGILGGGLSKFTNIFNTAIGAAGVAQGLSKSLDQMTNQIFGNANEILGALGTDKVGGITSMPLGEMSGGKFTSLLGPQKDVLGKLVAGVTNNNVLAGTGFAANNIGRANSNNAVAMFGTIFRDYNAMATQGFGSLTHNLEHLGKDLQSLGNLSNLEDLLRIGTPGQTAQQLIMFGTSAGRYIQRQMITAGVGLNDINKPDNDDLARSLLGSVRDPEMISDAFSKLAIQRDPSSVASLEALVDREFLFPLSKDTNRFMDLNEIALHLAVCGAGNLENLSQLGALLASMETLAEDETLAEEYMPASINDINAIRSSIAPVSDYSGSGDLTVADFLGTAAGYRHTLLLPEMKRLLDKITATGILTNYLALQQVMADTLSGVYTTVNVNPPNVGPYVIGTYATLDLAVTAINAHIETELTLIANTATGDTLVDLQQLQSHHEEVSSQLYKEEVLRQQYGIYINDSTETIDTFAGTGAQTVFTLSKPVFSASGVSVYVNGVYISKSRQTVNVTAKTVTLATAPASGALVEVIYGNGQEPAQGSASDIWNFSSSLETYATQTGFGKESDFLSRIITPDKDGSRIKAAMIQARNKERAQALKVDCQGFNRTLSDFYEQNPSGTQSFTDRTGIWSNDPARAAEIYVQDRFGVDSPKDYLTARLKSSKFRHQENWDDYMTYLINRLMFYTDGEIAATELVGKLYAVHKDTYRNGVGEGYLITYNDNLPVNGYSLGPWREIVSEVMRVESIKDANFAVPLSEDTRKYLQDVEIDIKALVGVVQKTLLANGSAFLGLTEADVRGIYGMPSVSQYLLRAIAEGGR